MLEDSDAYKRGWLDWEQGIYFYDEPDPNPFENAEKTAWREDVDDNDVWRWFRGNRDRMDREHDWN
jgi:hypothetical protein